MRGCEEFKLMNLELERVRCDDLTQDVIEKKYSKYLLDFSRKEFEQQFLLSEDRVDEVFGILCSFIEDTLFKRPPVLYAQTTRMLKFYRNHLRRRQQEVLFVTLNSIDITNEQIRNLVDKLTKTPNVTVVLTDLKDGPGIFSLVEDPLPIGSIVGTMRFIDYSRLYNEITGEILLLNDIPKESHDLDNLYYLKYKPSDVD
jgi:hypothetical protein